jgi:hypothetical protein
VPEQLSTLDDVELGAYYKDTVTQFEGIATARYEFLNGCVRVLLETLDGGEVKEHAFDVQRLQRLHSGIALSAGRSGGARRTPPPAAVPGR